ncbi:MAG TPA: hypothetical protein VE953_21010 [Terriglobales bacterium]|nr:hypothetical protein [Terriglobales bacterium]
MEAGGARRRSAAAWIGLALVLVVVAGVVYLRPTRTSPVETARTTFAGPRDELLGGASFADADRGAVTVTRFPPGPGNPIAHYATSDGGRTWSRSDEIVYEPPMAVEWRGGLGGAARVSADDGRTWRPLAVPEVDATSTLPTFLDARHGLWVVRAGLAGQPLENKLWRTDDGGGSWRRLTAAGLPGGAPVLGVRWLDPLRGLAATSGPAPALYLTEDGGETWRSSLTAVSPLPATRSLLVWPLRLPGHLLAWLTAIPQEQARAGSAFAGSSPGFDLSTFVETSVDGGATWGPPIAGPHLRTASLGPPAVDPAGRLLLLDGRRLWVSVDGGGTWTARVIQVPAGETPDSLLEAAGGALFASAVSDTRPAAEPGLVDRLLRSTDGGVHWESVPLPSGS